MKPNIILVLLDGSRTDRLSLSDKFLDLQKKGTLLNNVTAAYPYTFAALNAIFTGLFGKENGVDAYYKMFKLKDSVPFLPEILKNNGYFTTCDLISNKVISNRGFDIYQSHDEYVDDLTKKHPEFLRDCFAKRKEKPLFTFLQFSRIHTVTVSEVLKKYDWDDKKYYENIQQNLQNYDKVFAEAVNYANIIHKTINELDKSNQTIIIFFCDHGTGVGERFGERNYGVFTYEETIKTFYLFIGPKISKNKKSDEMLTTLQIFPTILELSGIDTKSLTLETSVASFLNSKSTNLKGKPFTFSETGGLQGPFPSPKSPNVFCVKTNEFKLIFQKSSETWELYDLKNDPTEQNNLYGKNLKIESVLQKKLLDWINR